MGLSPKSLMGFPGQIEEALAIVESRPLLVPHRTLTEIVVCGMGGSAVGGDLLRACLGQQLRRPLISVREGELPAFVGASTLVVACSYSGETQETLAAFDEARRRGATLVCITSGGRLGLLASRHQLPCFQLPAGMPPRSVVGYFLVFLLEIARASGLGPDLSSLVRRSLPSIESMVDRFGPQTASRNNLAKTLAIEMQSRLPVVLGSGRLEALARRWANQMSENAKVPAFFQSLPESAHNSVVGWLEGDQSQHLHFSILSDPRDDPFLSSQAQVLHQELKKAGASVAMVNPEGENRLERIWWLLLLGDFSSLYLAELRGVDPLAIPSIERLKVLLKKRIDGKLEGPIRK